MSKDRLLWLAMGVGGLFLLCGWVTIGLYMTGGGIDWLWYGLMAGGMAVFCCGLGGARILWRGEDVNLSEEERRIVELRRETELAEKRRLKEVKKVARELRKKSIEALTRVGFSYVYERHGATSKMSQPRIRHVLYTKDAVYMRIEQMPFRTSFTDLMKEEVAQNVGLYINRECRFVWETDIGMWLQVGLRSGLAAIPKFFAWHTDKTEQNALELLHKTKYWQMAVGMTENRRFVYEDVRDLPHLLVAGATDGGKSVFLNQLLATLIKRNPPSRLRLVLIDLKGGLEFTDYEELPHLWRDIVIDDKAVPEVLNDIIAEKNRRFAMLRNNKFRKIQHWNKMMPNKLPYLFVFFDEIAQLMLNKKISPLVDSLVRDLAAQGRAVGIHLVLCTQIPTKDVLSTVIRGNIVTRVCFATDHTGSKIVLNNERAAKIPPKTGRAIYMRGVSQMEIQAPLITDAQIKSTIASVGVDTDSEEDELKADELFRFALETFEGQFTFRKMLDEFSQLTQPFYNKLVRTYDYNLNTQQPIIEVDGKRYILTMVRMRGGKGRKLLPINGHVPATAEELMGMTRLTHV